MATFIFVDVVAVPVKDPVITPAFIVTPDIPVAEVTYKLPPIPTPPDTINDPVVVDTEAVVDVTDIPDEDKISVLGLKLKVESLEIAAPERLPEPT